MSLRVKLVAVASNEAAYLPEWILHHIHFGFDAIDVYVNNNSDNSLDYRHRFTYYDSVSFRDGDVFSLKDGSNLQTNCYRAAFKEAMEEGFTHVMFLDIDEFWTPLDFRTSIHEFIASSKYGVTVFPWLVSYEEDSPFSSAFSISCLSGNLRPEVKSLIPTDFPMRDLRDINMHTVRPRYDDIYLPDGSPAKLGVEGAYRAGGVDAANGVYPAVILHRMYRSRMEYVSMLTATNPVQVGTGDVFKLNRAGYREYDQAVRRFHLPTKDYIEYHASLGDMWRRVQADHELAEARMFITKRFSKSADALDEHGHEQPDLVEKYLRNVDLDDLKRNFYMC